MERVAEIETIFDLAERNIFVTVWSKLKTKPIKKGTMPARKGIFQMISDDAVQAKTDKVWRDWFRILDKFGVKEKGHTQAARYLRDKHGLSDWWAQAVTIRYEWERGLRRHKSAR